jgi:ribosome biogenesis GTPase / thiamine phosphate phosphatase
LFNATIYKSTGSWYLAKDQQGHTWRCRIKGKMKIDKTITSTNPIAVGDVIVATVEDTLENTAIISEVLPRRNYMIRVSPHNKHQQHIIASNLDQAIIIASIKSPRTSLGFIDRFLITAEMYGAPAIIVINKTDLLTADDQPILDQYKNIYTALGYPFYTVSAEQNSGMDTIADLVEGKQTLFTGHSGVGKSTIINALLPHLALRTMEVSDWSGKGMHTTTYAEMFDLDKSGTIIDTPGIRELGIVQTTREELGGYFVEIKQHATDCKFNNCKHINEPSCAVMVAVQNNQISTERYYSYINILESLDTKNY